MSIKMVLLMKESDHLNHTGGEYDGYGVMDANKAANEA